MGIELCDAAYIDERFTTERWLYRDELLQRDAAGELSTLFPHEPVKLQSTVKSMFAICRQIYICHSAQSFAAALAHLNGPRGQECTPIFAFIDVESDEGAVISRRQEARDSESNLESRSVVPFSGGFSFSSETANSYGVQLLSRLASDLQLQDGPKLIMPVAMLRTPGGFGEEAEKYTLFELSEKLCDPFFTLNSLPSRCLDAGATDVLCQPLQDARVESLLVDAYRVRRSAQKEMSRFMSVKKARKQSWVGVHTEKPYGYLREAMVSKLLESICHPEQVIEDFQDGGLDIAPGRKVMIEYEVGMWKFPAHDLSDDELVYAACIMFQHAMKMPEVGQWRLTDDELQTFVLASRAAYKSFVLYHNFRHAVDVLQSVFYILITIGALPAYHMSNTFSSPSKSPIASLISPFDALTLLIAAIGHDVGHPGVNNVFLVRLNAPLAQLYNDSSVLEAFHCAAFSQILRRYWPTAFNDANLRKLLISSILATDMGVHFTYMTRMAELKRKYYENGNLSVWTPQDQDAYSALLCGLIIKCADISNVARPWGVAEMWTNCLQEEFAHQGEMEKEIGMETALFGGPPELGNILKLAVGQINFMTIFALPLFEGVAEFFPEISCTVRHIKSNKGQWQEKVAQEEGRVVSPLSVERSPRSQSPVGRTLDMSTNRDVSPTEAFDFKLTNDYADDEHFSGPQSSDDENSIAGESSGVTLTVHKPHGRSSTNRPNSSYGIARDTRTQSESTTTNTEVTPVSPATNATSFATLDSSDEKDGSDLSSASDVYPLDEIRSRPSSSGVFISSNRLRFNSNHPPLPRKPRTSQSFEEFGKTHRMVTTILGNGRNGFAVDPAENNHLKHENMYPPQEQYTQTPPQHNLQRKKSRIRLAFWRKRSPY